MKHTVLLDNNYKVTIDGDKLNAHIIIEQITKHKNWKVHLDIKNGKLHGTVNKYNKTNTLIKSEEYIEGDKVYVNK